MDVFRVFDALNSVEKTRPVIDAVREHGGLRRGRDLLHGRPPRPGRDHLHPRLLPARRRAVRRRGRARPGHQGHGRAPAAAGGDRPRGGAARPVRRSRSACTRTTPPAASWPRTWPPSRRASTASTAPPRRWPPGGSQPSLGALLAAIAHADRDPALAGGLDLATRPASSRTGTRSATSTRRSRPGSARPRPACTATRSPAASCRTCARRPTPSAWATDSPRCSRRTTTRTSCWAVRSRSPRAARSSATWRCGWSRPASAGPTSSPTRAHHDLPASVIAFLQGQLGVPEGGFLEPFTSQVLAGKPPLAGAGVQRRRPRRPGRSRDAAGRPHPAHAARPRPRPSRPRAARTATSRVLPTHAYLYGLQTGSTEVIDIAAGQQMFVELDAIGDLDETGRRSVHLRANGQPIVLRVVDERAPEDGERAPQGRGRQPRPPGRLRPRRHHRARQGRRPGAGRRQGRDHRGDEDGVGRHRRHRRYRRHRARAGQGPGRARRPRRRHDPGPAA